MHLRSVIIILLISSSYIRAQIDEDFNLSDVSSLTQWQGDLDNFIINDAKQLQLNALDGGSSIIYAPISTADLAEWEFYFNMDFAPSNSNRLRIYLHADAQDLISGNGYFLEIGETGSDDNLEFYRQDNGQANLIAQGEMGTLGSDPAEALINVKREANGLWSIATAYDGAGFTQLELELLEETYPVSEGFFGFECSYTATRVDKFLFDNVFVGSLREDNAAPVLIRTEIIDATHIRLLFDELIKESSALNIENFEIDNGIGNPTSITLGDFNNELTLELSTALQDGIVYELSITDITDLSANTLNTEIELILASTPTAGELVINEILFDPYPDGNDFVELYNNSGKYLKLSSLVISNSNNEQSRNLEGNVILAPFQYMAITPNADALARDYILRIPENIVENDLPAFSNADGNITISTIGASEMLDSYTYDENDHSPWIDDTEGVSLERLNPSTETSASENWQSASSNSGFATPGYENSNFFIENVSNDEFVIKKKTFSPDGDGFDDFLEINYRVSQSGFVLNMRVFDDKGHLVKTLANNEILGRSGSVTWNGDNDQGTMSGLGIYIIFLEYFNSEGSLNQKKLSCVLAKQLD